MWQGVVPKGAARHQPEEELQSEEREDRRQRVATPPVPVDELFGDAVLASPPQDARAQVPEPEPHGGEDAGSLSLSLEHAAEGDSNRVREVCSAPSRRMAHLFANCSGLASVKPGDVITENLCFTGGRNRITGTRLKDEPHSCVVGDDAAGAVGDTRCLTAATADNITSRVMFER